MNEQTTLENAIGKTIRVFAAVQTPPCPPYGYLGILLEVNQKSITVHCKLGYTNQDKVLSFDEEDCKITKILLEESQEIIYQQQNNKKTKFMNKIDDVTLETLLERTGKNILVQTKKDGIEQGKLSNVKTSSISIISEIGEKTTIAFKKIGAICLLGQHPEILYQN